MGAGTGTKRFPAELARAGEARHHIAWLAAAAGLRGEALHGLAVAAEALLTDVLLGSDGGVMEVFARSEGGLLRIEISHPTATGRVRGLEAVLERFLDGHELSPERSVLVKRLG